MLSFGMPSSVTAASDGTTLPGGAPQATQQNAPDAEESSAAEEDDIEHEDEEPAPQDGTTNKREKEIPENTAEDEESDTNPDSGPSTAEAFDPRGDLTLIVRPQRVTFLVCSRALARSSLV